MDKSADKSAAHYENLEWELATLRPQWRENVERTNHNIQWALSYWMTYLKFHKWPNSEDQYREWLQKFNSVQCVIFLQWVVDQGTVSRWTSLCTL